MERARYCYVNFENKDDVNAIMENSVKYSLKNRHIHWENPNTKCCHSCHSPDHIAKFCPRREEKVKNEARIKKLADIYTKRHVKADNMETIMKKAERISKPTNNLQKTYANITAEANTSALEKRFRKIETDLADINKILNNLVHLLHINGTIKEPPTPSHITKHPQGPNPFEPSNTPHKRIDDDDNDTDRNTHISYHNDIIEPHTEKRFNSIEEALNNIYNLLEKIGVDRLATNNSNTPYATNVN